GGGSGWGAERVRAGGGLWDLSTGGPPAVVLLGFAERGRGPPVFFFVVEFTPPAHEFVDLMHGAVVPHGEGELLRRRARQRDHRHLALPGLAHPALPRELLHPARPVAGCVAPLHRGPEVPDNQRREHHQDDQHAEYAEPTL